MRQRHRFGSLLLLALLAAPAPRAHADPDSKPYLLHLPGIGGFMGVDRRMLLGLEQGGVDAEIEHYDWTSNDPGLDALLAFDRNQKQAQLIADRLTEISRKDPGRKILVTCHSGGAGLAVWALERCPSSVKIETILFLAPALSPQYDLSRALAHVTNRAYVFYSALDPILGPGTQTFGTIDRVKTEAAGRVGFTAPAAADPAQYAKITAMPYLDRYIDYGNIGDHIGSMSTSFAENILAPLLGAQQQLHQQSRRNASATRPAPVRPGS